MNLKFFDDFSIYEVRRLIRSKQLNLIRFYSVHQMNQLNKIIKIVHFKGWKTKKKWKTSNIVQTKCSFFVWNCKFLLIEKCSGWCPAGKFFYRKVEKSWLNHKLWLTVKFVHELISIKTIWTDEFTSKYSDSIA